MFSLLLGFPSIVIVVLLVCLGVDIEIGISYWPFLRPTGVRSGPFAFSHGCPVARLDSRTRAPNGRSGYQAR